MVCDGGGWFRSEKKTAGEFPVGRSRRDCVSRRQRKRIYDAKMIEEEEEEQQRSSRHRRQSRHENP